MVSAVYNFNPRSHEGSDGVGKYTVLPTTHFNPRSHEGSDVSQLISVCFLSEFQSTLPRGERRYWTSPTAGLVKISIHAPTRGATRTVDDGGCSIFISIHAPTRGATSATGKACKLGIFQSTLPRGERQNHPHSVWFPLTISIHAPTRGATRIQVLPA